MIFRMLSALLALLLLATAADEVQPPPRGRLCIGENCSDTTTATIAVKPADHERRFFWLSADAKTAYAGVIAAKAESVVLDPEAFSELDVTTDGDAARGWPLDVRVTLAAGPEKEWKWTLDREAAKRLRRLYVPRGTYRVTASAEHQHTIRTRVTATEKPSKLALIFFPLPLARGIVVDAEDKPIAAATVALPDETFCATANEQGAFTCELPERLPEVIVVSAGGYAPREVEIRRQTVGPVIDFGRVRLSSARALTLKIVRPDPAPARVSLFLDAPRYNHSKLKSVPIKEREESVRFDAAPGKYFVVVEGEGPLERLEVPLVVKDENSEHEIRVEPFQLVGTARLGDDPLEGTVEIVSPEHTWRERLPVANGAFGATMWQAGAVRAWVSGPAIRNSDLVQSPQLGDDPSRWDIRIAKRLIAGRVFDAATKAAVTETNIEVVADSGDSQSYFSAEVGPDGSYEILASQPATYTLRVNTPHHMPYTVELLITAEDRIRTHDIALEQGVLQPIDVVRPTGGGVRALILEGVQPDGVNPEFMTRTDERGHYELRGLPRQSRLLYVIPPYGSLAVVRVQLPAAGVDARPLQVIVPPPVGALRVSSVDAKGKPRPTGLLIRYNGEFVPRAILRFVTGEMGSSPTGESLLSRLPAGTYEIWSIAGQDDERQLIASNGTSREPVRVGLSSGEQAVTVVAP
jgi:hypothetical protein